MTTNDRTMSAADMTRTSNEWMRRYIEEPEKFSREFQEVTQFLADESAGREPSYGEQCTAYRFKLLEEMNAAITK
jgi:hypothetical protein